MDVWLSTDGLMQMRYSVWRKHPHGYLLRDDGLAVSSTEFVVKGSVEAIVVVGCGCWEGAVRVRGGRGDDGEGKHGQVVLLGEAYLGRRGIEGRLEGAIQRRERNFEVDDVVRC